MRAAKLPKSSSDPEVPSFRPPRPRFHHRCTDDRLREGSGRPISFMSSKIPRNRKSIFKELGLDTDEPGGPYSSEHEFGELTGLASPASAHAPEGGHDDNNNTEDDDDDENESRRQQQRAPPGQESQDARYESMPQSPTSPSASPRPWYARLTRVRRPKVRTASSAPPPTLSTMTRISSIALLIAVLLPGFSYFAAREEAAPPLADAGVIHRRPETVGPVLETRADSPTAVCKRWAHQAAQLNGTLYIYGGQAISSASQTTNTWNNDFLALDLTKSWPTSSPALQGLPQPSGPPAVAMGYLWNDYNNLYLYGGEFADDPYVEPAPVSTWKYSIGSQTWTEYSAPQTSAGNNSDPAGQPVQRAAEGAGLSVPELGLSWYFGGHLDQSTTPGWSNQIARVYLKSLLEFTHPGYVNDGVFDLAGGTGAGDGGAYRNITQGGLQTNDGFSERADGVLVFVPGWGEKGVLIGLAGGQANTFANDLSTLDVYDIASSQWYHQNTTGDAPSVRVNPCAVTASAPDASSFQIYLYGGQNLQPYKQQIQYSDIYILTIPAFTWIRAPQPPNSPPPRAGHTCTLRDGQIIILGGYTSPSPSGTIACESPGIAILNATSLLFTPSFSALSQGHASDLDPGNSVLSNSFGYRVPDIVASVIGGGAGGGATVSTPAAGKPTGGPFATGKAPVFTVTQSVGGGGATATVTEWGSWGGATATATGTAGNGGGGGGGGGSGGGNGNGGVNGGLIAAGVLAGVAGLAAAYLGYCAWLYRRQVRAYRSHLAVANRYSPAASGWLGRAGSKGSRGDAVAAGGIVSEKDGGGGAVGEEIEQAPLRTAIPPPRFSVSTVDSMSLGWAVPPAEPRFFFDEDRPSPGSGTGSGTGSGSGVGSGFGSGFGSGSGSAITHGTPGARPPRRSGSVSGGSTSSAERLLDGHEPSFFSVVLGPRRALRVVNGLEDRDSGGE